MEIGRIAHKNYDSVQSLTPLHRVLDNLIKKRFLVVEDKKKYVGILTPADALRHPHKLVVDCLTDKPCIDYEFDLTESLYVMEKHALFVLPVFKGKEF